MRPLFLSCLAFGLALTLQAQTTGTFQLEVTFPQADYNVTRTLYYFVPTDYDSGQEYPLVVGFRGGPHTNAGQFRDQLTFMADSIGAIILCPENEAHFWNEEGLTKKLFQYSVDTTSVMYNIDPEMIYLTGLSYGGRHAVIVAMDTDDGPIPNLRGVIPFAAGSDSQLQPNYSSAMDFAPACLCIGLDDNSNFINVSNTLHNDLMANGATSTLNEIPGVGHTVAFPTYPDEMMECWQFIEAQYQTTSVTVTDEIMIRVFPNPASDRLFIQWPESVYPQRIFLTDIAGAILLEVTTMDNELDISNLPDGLVFLVVQTASAQIVERVLIQRN